MRLERAYPDFVSGGAIAAEFGVTRTAVWKAVVMLRRGGYRIESARGSGYRLLESPDRLTAGGIRRRLPPGCDAGQIVVMELADSTNTEAKRLALDGAPHGSLVAAEAQRAGRGRFSRGFFSPPGTGLYMTALLRPGVTAADATLITVAASLAVCGAVRRLTGLSPMIKWVNDVLVDGKKICGILTEATSDSESGLVSSVVVGIGVNVSVKTGDFPEEIRDKARSLFPDGRPGVSRDELAAAILGGLLGLCDERNLRERSFMREYRALSYVLGRDIVFMRGGGERVRARAIDVDDDGRLLVDPAGGGGVVALNSGEVSIIY